MKGKATALHPLPSGMRHLVTGDQYLGSISGGLGLWMDIMMKNIVEIGLMPLETDIIVIFCQLNRDLNKC
jgi:hypothetical protein